MKHFSIVGALAACLFMGTAASAATLDTAHFDRVTEHDRTSTLERADQAHVYVLERHDISPVTDFDLDRIHTAMADFETNKSFPTSPAGIATGATLAGPAVPAGVGNARVLLN